MAIDFTNIENEYTRIQNAKADIITAMNKLGANISEDSKMDEISVSVEDTASGAIDDGNLVAENIKKDVTIFGVTGTYEGSGGSAESLPCSVTIIVPGSFGHVNYIIGFDNNDKPIYITGTIDYDSQYTISNLKYGSMLNVSHGPYNGSCYFVSANLSENITRHESLEQVGIVEYFMIKGDGTITLIYDED